MRARAATVRGTRYADVDADVVFVVLLDSFDDMKDWKKSWSKVLIKVRSLTLDVLLLSQKLMRSVLQSFRNAFKSLDRLLGMTLPVAEPHVSLFPGPDIIPDPSSTSPHHADFTCLKMPPRIPKKPQTEGSFNFDPDSFFEKWATGENGVPKDNDFQKCISRAFGLRSSDAYVYKAIAEVTLSQAQTYLNYGNQGRLLEWYRDEECNKVFLSPLPSLI